MAAVVIRNNKKENLFAKSFGLSYKMGAANMDYSFAIVVCYLQYDRQLK